MSTHSMEGRVCVVTGGNAGIGRATALGLARLGATVAIIGRSRERGETAAAEIRRETGNLDVSFLLADLADQAAIRRVAAEIEEMFERLDVLINNAAVTPQSRMLSPEGIEMQLAVNHLAPFLLTNLLLDLLRRSGPARIVNVSSEAHRRGRIDFDDLQSERRYRPMSVYAMTKLANILFTRELAERLAGTDVTANALHPGVISTKLLESFIPHPFRFLSRPFFGTPETGARTSIYLATSPEVAGVRGRYFVDCREKAPSPAAHDREAQKRLWEESMRLTHLDEEGGRPE